MAAAHSIVEIEFGATYQKIPLGLSGRRRWRCTAVLPSGQSSCTISGIPQLDDQTQIHVQMAEGGVSSAGLIEISASRTHGENHGAITIGTANASTVTGDAAFIVDGQNI